MAKYTAMTCSLKSRKNMADTKLTTTKGLAINARHLKILHALKVLPNTIRRLSLKMI